MEDIAMLVFYLPITFFEALVEKREYQVARVPITP
jgi:hypothetical protein